MDPEAYCKGEELFEGTCLAAAMRLQDQVALPGKANDLLILPERPRCELFRHACVRTCVRACLRAVGCACVYA